MNSIGFKDGSGGDRYWAGFTGPIVHFPGGGGRGQFFRHGTKLLHAQPAISEALNTGAQLGVGSPATAAAHRL
jgi:hypothetical protein